MSKARRHAPFTLPRSQERAGALVTRRSVGDGAFHTIDLSNAKQPDRTYYARQCWVEYDRSVVSLVFCQPTREPEGLRSLVIVNMTPAGVVQLIDSVDSMNNPGLDAICESTGIETEPAVRIGGEPDQAIELSAHVCSVAVSGRETALDFYKLSPFAVLKIQANRVVDVEPQVRIDLRTSAFVGLVDGLRSLENEFPKDSFFGRERNA